MRVGTAADCAASLSARCLALAAERAPAHALCAAVAHLVAAAGHQHQPKDRKTAPQPLYCRYSTLSFVACDQIIHTTLASPDSP